MENEVVPGSLLVAGVSVSDGIFDQTVVLVLDADESGTVGVVLNRISEVTLSQALPQWEHLMDEPRVLFDGGPVSQQGAICLATPSGSDDPPGWRPVFDRVGLLNLDTPVEIADGAYTSLRCFAGYAGWGPGQLAAELEFGMWHVVPALAEDVIDPEPTTMWRRVLRRQRDDLALLSTWTAEPGLN